jgi:hypothetical protein
MRFAAMIARRNAISRAIFDIHVETADRAEAVTRQRFSCGLRAHGIAVGWRRAQESAYQEALEAFLRPHADELDRLNCQAAVLDAGIDQLCRTHRFRSAEQLAHALGLAFTIDPPATANDP